MISLGETYNGGEDISMHLNMSADYIDNFIEDYERKLVKTKKVDIIETDLIIDIDTNEV